MEDSVNILKFAEARASEIKTLMEDVTSKGPKLPMQRLPYHMRRRAASHNPKRLPRSLRVKIAEETRKKTKKKPKTHKSLLEEYNNRQKPGALWLPTHIWFAKRFHMKNMFGYKLPLQATGKRFRSSYRATVKSALIQDLSYFCCIELKGPQENLLSHLMLLTDDSLGINFAAESIIDGSREGTCFVYQPHSFPYHAIGPVSFLWNPSCIASSVNHGNLERQLWIWCHPTVLEELINVFVEIFNLKFLSDTDTNAKKHYDFASKTNYMKTKLHFQKEPIYSSNEVTMIILKDTLIRHRLIGPNALSILTSVLKCNGSYQMPQNVVKAKSPDEQMEIPNNTDCAFSRNTSLTVTEDSLATKQRVWEHLTATKSLYYVPLKTVIGLYVDDPRLYVTSKESDSFHNDIVDAQDLSVCEEFSNPSISYSEIWDQDVRNKVTASQIPEHVINSERSKYVIPIANDLRKCTSTVPVIVIHQPPVNGYGSGWDIIAPQGWGMAFWIPFIYHGAQPAGFDDHCCTNFESGQATFPISFPDTKAGAVFEESNRESNLKQFYKYSRAKRPNFKVLGIVSPYFMPWGVLVRDWHKEFLDKHRFLNEPIMEHMFKSPSVIEEKQGDFFTLRSRKEIIHLRRLCSLLDRNHKHPSNESAANFEKLHLSTIQTLLLNKTHFKSLIVVRVKCLFRGTPVPHSGIYLPTESDLKCLKGNPKYFGPVEPHHSLDDRYLKMPSNKRRRILKEEAKIESKKLDRPEVDTIFSNSDYKVVGFVSEGGYSRLGAQGLGLGHCSLIGLLFVMDLCAKMKMAATVLVREQHNFQYRLANIDVLENPF